MLSYLSSFFYSAEEEEVSQPKTEETSTQTNESSENFYYLSLINEGNNQWSIHGLWPQYNKENYPSYCKDVEFDYYNLQPILAELERYWYSNRGTLGDEDFWKHEWQKHGSCMFTDMDEFDYFAHALSLYYVAVKKGLPKKYYDAETKKCLIPVSLEFNFMSG